MHDDGRRTGPLTTAGFVPRPASDPGTAGLGDLARP
jgi:hypothetical protein